MRIIIESNQLSSRIIENINNDDLSLDGIYLDPDYHIEYQIISGNLIDLMNFLEDFNFIDGEDLSEIYDYEFLELEEDSLYIS